VAHRAASTSRATTGEPHALVRHTVDAAFRFATMILGRGAVIACAVAPPFHRATNPPAIGHRAKSNSSSACLRDHWCSRGSCRRGSRAVQAKSTLATPCHLLPFSCRDVGPRAHRLHAAAALRIWVNRSVRAAAETGKTPDARGGTSGNGANCMRPDLGRVWLIVGKRTDFE
jgi:hypothetical protein